MGLDLQEPMLDSVHPVYNSKTNKIPLTRPHCKKSILSSDNKYTFQKYRR